MDLQIASHVVMRVYITWRRRKGPPRPTSVYHRTPMISWGLQRHLRTTSGSSQGYLRTAGENVRRKSAWVWIYGTSHEIPQNTSEPPQNHHATRYLIIHRKNCCIFVTLWGIFRKKWDIPESFYGHPQNLSLRSVHQQRNEGLKQWRPTP